MSKTWNAWTEVIRKDLEDYNPSKKPTKDIKYFESVIKLKM